MSCVSIFSYNLMGCSRFVSLTNENKICIRYSVHWHRQYNKFYLLYLSTVSHGPWYMYVRVCVCVDEWDSGFRCSLPNICIHASALTIQYKQILFNFSFSFHFGLFRNFSVRAFPWFLRFDWYGVVPVSLFLPLVFFISVFRYLLVYSIFFAVGTNLL